MIPLFCFLFTKTVKYCILLRVNWEIWTDEWVITDDNEEEEEEGDYYGMVHLEVVWEEVEVFWCQLLTLFYMKFMKKMKKINHDIELLCIIRSFLPCLIKEIVFDVESPTQFRS